MQKLASVLLAALFLLPGLGSGSQARVWFVHSDGSGQAPTIQAGIDSCAAGDTVVAMPGVYTGEGNWNVDFMGKSIVVMAAASYDSTITDKTIVDCEWREDPVGSRAFYFHSNEDSTSVLAGFEIRNVIGSWCAIECDHSSPTITCNRTAGLEHAVALQCTDSSPKIIGNSLCADRSGWGAVVCEGGSPYLADNTIFTWDCGGCWFGAVSWHFSNCTSLQMRGNTIGAGFIDNCTGIIYSNEVHGDWYVYGLDISGSTLQITNNTIFAGLRTAAIACAQSEVTIAHNRIAGSVVITESLPSLVTDNSIFGTDEGGWPGALAYGGDSSTEISKNTIESTYDASGIVCNSSARVFGNLVISYCGHWDVAGIYCTGSPIIEGNTIIRKYDGDGMYFGPGSSAIVRNNIVAGQLQYDPFPPSNARGIYTESDSIIVACCNVYGNEGGNYVGIPDQTGLNGNISADPLFCDAAHNDYSIHALSPCAPGHHPNGADCGLIGAVGVGCDYVETLVQSYRAVAAPPAILVTWELAKGAASDLRFVALRKKAGAGEYEERHLETGIDHNGATYSFRDTGCEPGVAYRYRVDVVDDDGRRELFETDVVALPAMPLTLHQNHPNPFNPSTTIEYYLPEKANVRLEIYDISGRLIATLADGEMESGAHAITWNGFDNGGRPVASGIYFSRLAAGKEAISKKMIMLR